MAALIEKKKRKTNKKESDKNIFKIVRLKSSMLKMLLDNVQAGMPWQHMERFTDRIIATDLIA